MTIGEALKKERLKLGLSKYQFSKGIIDPKFYGKVEDEDRNIGSRALVKLMLIHHINISEFFDQIRDECASQKDIELETLNKEMNLAVLEKDLEKIKTISNRYAIIAPSSVEYLRSQVFIVYLNHQSASSELVTKIQQVLDKHENMFQDIQAVRLFSNALPILPIEQLDCFMKIILNKISDKESLTIEEQRRISQLCNNYLKTCLDRNIFSENIEKIDLLFQKITHPEMLIYKLLEKRDYYLLKKDSTKAVELTKILNNFGYKF